MPVFHRAYMEGGIPRRRVSSAAISPVVRTQYASALRHMEAEWDGVAISDSFLTAYVNGLRGRGKSAAYYESALGRMWEALGTEPTTDALLTEHVATTLGVGQTVASAAFHISAAIWPAKRNGLHSPNSSLTIAH